MSFKFYFTIAVILTSLIAQSQQLSENIDTNIYLSEKFGENYRFLRQAFVVEDDSDLFVGNFVEEGTIIYRYDKHLNVKSRFHLKADDPDYEIREAYIEEDKLYLIEYYLDEKEDRSEYTIIVLNKETFEEIERKKILSIDVEALHSSHLSNDLDSSLKGYIQLSEKYVLIAFDISIEGEEAHKFYLVNKTGLELESKMDFNVEIDGGKFDLAKLAINDDDASVYVYGLYYGKRKTFKLTHLQKQFEAVGLLYKINKNIEISNYINVEKEVHGLRLEFLESKIIAIGTYLVDPEKGHDYFGGTAVLKFDKNNLKQYDSSYQPFSQRYIDENYDGDRTKAIYNMYIGDLEELDNGNIRSTTTSIREYIENGDIVLKKSNNLKCRTLMFEKNNIIYSFFMAKEKVKNIGTEDIKFKSYFEDDYAVLYVAENPVGEEAYIFKSLYNEKDNDKMKIDTSSRQDLENGYLYMAKRKKDRILLKVGLD